jgi:ribose transport system permease protein
MGKKIKFDYKLFVNKIGILLGLVLLCTFFTFGAKNFLSPKNLSNIMLQSSITAIVALGMTFVITGGGIDLSVGSVVAVSSIFVTKFMVGGMSIELAIIFAIALGTMWGVLNGFIIAHTNIAPFIVTLGTQSIARGVVYVVCDGVPITNLPTQFNVLGGGKFMDAIPYPIIFTLLISAVMGVIFYKSRFGRYVFALGSNENAAFLSGVNTVRIKKMMYIVCAILASIAGIILASRVVSGQPNAGENYETNAIAAAVIGGTSMAGGQGSIVGTLIGALLMGVLQNGLNLMGVSYFYQKIAIGVVIIVAVYIDLLRNRIKK